MTGGSSSEDHEDSSTLGSFSEEDSSDLVNDTSSSSSSSSSSSMAGVPLHELPTLKKHLPLKRGLSKYYQGKSQSHTCFSNIRCLEDLAKPEKHPLKKLRITKGCGGGLGSRPRTITKKASSSRGSSFSSTSSRRKNSCSLGGRPVPVHPPPHRPTNITF